MGWSVVFTVIIISCNSTVAEVVAVVLVAEYEEAVKIERVEIAAVLVVITMSFVVF